MQIWTGILWFQGLYNYSFHYMLMTWLLIEGRNAQGHFPLLSGFPVYLYGPKYQLVVRSTVPYEMLKDYHR